MKGILGLVNYFPTCRGASQEVQKCTCFRREYPKTVVPKTTGDKKSAVDGCHKTIATDFYFLTEVVTQVTTLSWVRGVTRLC